MEIRVLRYFLTVVREESITRASEVLHITQPTLSRQLAQMEEEIGVKLFERGKRKISLTTEGVLLRRRAEEIIALVDKTERELSEQEELIGGKITIGCGEIAAVTVLAELIEKFHQEFPFVTFDLVTATADQVKEQMDKGLIDIGLLLEPIEIDKYDFIRLNHTERWVVLMPVDDPMTALDGITPQDLKNVSLILPRRSHVQNELANWFGDYVKELKGLFTSNLATNAALMVQKRLGYALVIEGALPFWDSEKIAYRPLKPELSATSVLAWKRQQPVNLATTKLIQTAKHFLGLELFG